MSISSCGDGWTMSPSDDSLPLFRSPRPTMALVERVDIALRDVLEPFSIEVQHYIIEFVVLH